MGKQIEAKKALVEKEKQGIGLEGAVLKRQAAQAQVEEQELLRRRREQRRIHDGYLIQQIRDDHAVRRGDDLSKALPHLNKREMEINQSIFRDMQRDKFSPTETAKYVLT